MKVFAIGDLHLSINNPKPMDIFGGAWDNYVETIVASWQRLVNDDDIVLIAGDISWAMTLEQAKPDLDFIGSLKGKKVLIRGNHDYWWKSISAVRASLTKDTYAVQNDCLRLGNCLICGSRGWTVPEKNALPEDEKIYSRELIRMEMSLKSMQSIKKEGDVCIAMIHYPPFNIRLESSPFTELFSAYGADAVVYGHLHGKDCRVVRLSQIKNVKYYLTSCDLVGNELVHIIDL